MTNLHTDEGLAYHLSLQDEPISHSSIARKYGLTDERATIICNAVINMKVCRTMKEECWQLIDIKLPPPFRELLFSDGENVFANRLSSLIIKKEDVEKNLSWINPKKHGEIIWWREMPISPRELYGI